MAFDGADHAFSGTRYPVLNFEALGNVEVVKLRLPAQK